MLPPFCTAAMLSGNTPYTTMLIALSELLSGADAAGLCCPELERERHFQESQEQSFIFHLHCCYGLLFPFLLSQTKGRALK